MPGSRVIAILISDIHLSHVAPVARSAEPDWYVAMARPLRQVKKLAEKHECPVLCAGDIFDNWRSPPELINFAISELPVVFAIPGQHDLPMHRYEDMKKSAYWTLVEVGIIEDVGKGFYGDKQGIGLFGFPWGHKVKWEEDDLSPDVVRLALIHRYLWTKEIGGYPGAPADQNVAALEDRLAGYDVAVFGDNHLPFQAKSGDCIVVNCGCLIPRKSDERKLEPSAWLLMDDGRVKRHKLDTSEDRWLEPDEAEAKERENPGLDDFVAGLEELEADRLDFRDDLLRYAENVRPEVKQVIMEVIGE